MKEPIRNINVQCQNDTDVHDIQSNSENEFDITNYIPEGKDNAISRRQLCSMLGLSDRTVRDLIATARRKTPILNLQDGTGYFIPIMPDEVDLLKASVHQESSRLKSIGWSLHAARKMLREYEFDDQLMLELGDCDYGRR